MQQGIEILCPRFLSVPGIFRQFDGLFMALGSYLLMRRLRKRFDFNVIDAHFAYPDGYAATILGKWLKVPVTITMRGTEVPQSRNPRLRPCLVRALTRADRVFSVSDSLRRHAIGLGVAASRIRVIGNGVDAVKFAPVDRAEARSRLGLPEQAKIMVSVGALVERKGFHRVIDIMPELTGSVPDLHYLVVGVHGEHHLTAGGARRSGLGNGKLEGHNIADRLKGQRAAADRCIRGIDQHARIRL